MMRMLAILFLISFPVCTYGQTGITFKIEDLSPPEKLLRLESYETIYKRLIERESKLAQMEIRQNNIDILHNILAMSKAPDSLVSYGFNSFFNGMYEAYAQHRPFVLSPDMIWLLISQGFARHINANPEKFRTEFVDFSGRKSLVVLTDKDLIRDSIIWEELFPQFTDLIAQNTNQELVDILSSDFSTTTPTAKVASEITIMKAMEPYFEYIGMYIICGIPEITLLGTTEDWEKIVDKTRRLARYDLTWWTSELEPILGEFVKASKGDIDTVFWMNMFKYHSQQQYGAPNIIDGWIVKFFPYDKDGKRNNLNSLVGRATLPEEILKVDLLFIRTDGINTEEIPLELWAGFIGLEQNSENFALTPVISWMVRMKDTEETGVTHSLQLKNVPSSSGFAKGLELRVKEVPSALKALPEIYSLKLQFIGDVYIPEWLKDKRIGKLIIEGKISQRERRKILSWFPDTEITINNKEHNSGNNGWVVVSGNTIPEHVLAMEEIWILEIRNGWFGDRALQIPDALGNIRIEHLSLMNSTSAENQQKLIELLPETKIYIQGKRIR